MIVSMKLADIIKLDYTDYCWMNVICDICDKKYSIYTPLDTGEYIAEHHYGYKCKEYLTYTTADILDWKMEDDQFTDIVESLRANHDQPIAGLRDGEIIDGGHRLAAARYLGLRRVLVENNAKGSSQDSGRWHPGQPIIPIPSKDQK